MSLLRTAQASPTRKRSGKVSALRAKFENMSGGQSSSFRSNSILGGSATTANTDPELKKLVHDATKEVLNTHDESLSFDGDQSINSFMRTLSGSGSSSFSVSKAFHAVKRKMNHQKGADGSVSTPPPLLEVQKNNMRKVSLGGNLQMDFNFTMPIDRVHVQNAQQPSSSPKQTPQQASVSPKAKKEAYAKAEKMLAKLDEKQKLKAARAKQMMLELKKQPPRKSSAAMKASKMKVVKVTQVAEDTSTIEKSQASLNMSSQRAGPQNQKQRLLDRLEKMGLKPIKLTTGLLLLGPQDPSGFVVSYNPDDSTARSGSSSRSNEENLDPTSPRSVRTPKSTNRSTSRTMNFDESDLRRDRSNVGSQSSYRAMSESQISTRVSEDVTSQTDYPHQNHFGFADQDNYPQDHLHSGTDGDNDEYSIASNTLNPHGDDVAADIAQEILGGFERSTTSYTSPDTQKQRVETIRSFDLSVQVVSDGGGENFEAVHVDDANIYDDEGFEDNASSGNQPYVFEDSLNESFVSNYRSSAYVNEIYEMDRAMVYPEDDDDERSSGSPFDRYAIDGKESLNDVMDLAAERLSASDHPSQNPSYTDISFGMEDILNMAASRLGGSTGARGPSSFSFDSVMEFAAGRLSTTPKASADAVDSVNASEKGKPLQPNASDLPTLNDTNGRDDTAAKSWGELSNLADAGRRFLLQEELSRRRSLLSKSGIASTCTSFQSARNSSSSEQEDRATEASSRSQFKETIDPPPAEAFNHPIPIQMSPGKSLFDDLSHSMAPSSMSDSISALTPDERRGFEAKMKANRMHAPGGGENKSTRHRQDDAFHDKSDTTQSAVESYQEILKATPETEKQKSDSLPRSGRAGAFCSLLGGTAAPSGVGQPSPKMTEHSPAGDEGKSPYTVHQFPELASVELATPPSSPTNAVAAAKHISHKRQDGPNGSESLLNDDDEYWDTLSSIATESVIRSQKNFEEVSRPMGAEIYPLSSVDETSLEVESGCVCPWNEHLLLPRDHPDYTGPLKHQPVFDVVLNASSTESIDENIPVEISYLPDITGLAHLAREPQPSLAGSGNISASLGNLRSILTASSSSSSESSQIHSNGRSLDDNGMSADSFKGSYKGDVAGSQLKEAIMRGEIQAFVDSPKQSDKDMGYAEQKHGDSSAGHLADSITGPPPLPTLLDTETRSSIVEQSENSRLEKKENDIAGNHSYEPSTQEFLAEFEAALGTNDGSEMRGNNERMFPIDDRDETKPQTDVEESFNALTQLLSEDKTEDSYNSFDDEHNEHPENTLFVAQTRSHESQDRKGEQEFHETYQGMTSDDGSGNYRAEYQGHEEQEARSLNVVSQSLSEYKSADSDIVLDEESDNDDENQLLLAYSKSDDRMERNHRSMATFSTGSAEQHTEHSEQYAAGQFDPLTLTMTLK
ncbi:hypothetical protein MHU86_21963 [Fragilaria crotonensis]|nr:hypothetical protein MHU86_21963 [Fragilaria crotonensis]